MIPIQDLLNRIRWDPGFADGEFAIGYYDRIEARIVKIPFRQVRFNAGDHFSFDAVEDDGIVRTVPLHRVREVWRNAERIWHRDPPHHGAGC